MATTGIGTAARIVITSTAPTLILSPTNTAQRLTYQITASVRDVLGTPLSVQPQLYYDLLAGHGSATVSSTGLVTATAPGKVIVQVACASFGNSINLFTREGLPWNAITAEQTIQVTTGFILPDFQFSLSFAAGTYTISQTPVPNSTWNGTVVYSLGQKSAFPGSSAPTVIATITGTGTATFTNSSNFKLQGTDQTNGVYHAIYTYLNGGTVSPTFPQTSVRGAGDGPNGTSNSGQPRTVST
jgi:hypothetical protein